MKTLSQALLLALGALALAGTAFAQVPSTNDTSEGIRSNTGMGTGALGGPNAVNLTGDANTASGYHALGSNTTGSNNTASGFLALLSNTTGSNNTASGVNALRFNNGSDNTASGFLALLSNTTGVQNTASGSSALQSNTTGGANTASGYQALVSNTSGSANTASGAQALFSNNGDSNSAYGNAALQGNTTGSDNTASGVQALLNNTTGNFNTAFGVEALVSNTTGFQNTASGVNALLGNKTGSDNTASGVNALLGNTTGNFNTASGYSALSSNTTGSNNIAVGFDAGFNLTTGSHNIDIGSTGVAAESNTIRIGATQKATFIAGIKGISVTGSAVVVSSTGQLGVTVSSERFKTAIAPMGANTAKLAQLRPVTFHLKTDPQGALQYGLIAEEVAKVYPELVIRGERGRIEGVRYDELAPMLLNEFKAQRAQFRDIQQQQQRKIDSQTAEIRALKKLVVETQAGLLKLQSKDELVAHTWTPP